MSTYRTLSSLLRRTRSTTARIIRDHSPREVTRDLAATVQALSEETRNERVTYYVRPPAVRSESGMDTSMKLHTALHRLEGVHTFEIWHSDSVQFVITLPRRVSDTFESSLAAMFPQSERYEVERPFPSISVGDHVAGASIRLRNDYYRQILNPLGAQPMKTDPYNHLLDGLSNETGCPVVIQVAFTRAPDEWCKRWYLPLRPKLEADPDDTVWDRLPLIPRQQSCENLAVELKHQQVDQWVVDLISTQHEDLAFAADIRAFAVAESSDRAHKAVDTVIARFEDGYYDAKMNQGFVGRRFSRREFQGALQRFVRRELPHNRVRLGKHKHEPCILTLPELTGVAHLPTSNPGDSFAVSVPTIDWAFDPRS